MAEEAKIVATARSSGEVDFLLSLAAVLIRQNRGSEGLVLAEACYAMAEEDENALRFLCYARLKNKDYRGCLAASERLLNNSSKPAAAAFYLLRGKAFYALGQAELAANAIDTYARATRASLG